MKCPLCQEEIKALNVLVAENTLYEFAKNTPDNGFGYHNFGESLDMTVIRFKCPKCYKELPINPDEDSGLAFLNGEPEANWHKLVKPPTPDELRLVDSIQDLLTWITESFPETEDQPVELIEKAKQYIEEHSIKQAVSPEPEQGGLTPEQKQKYLKDGGLDCPYCGSTNLDTKGFGADDEGSETVECLDCHRKWIDDWKLIDVREHPDD